MCNLVELPEFDRVIMTSDKFARVVIVELHVGALLVRLVGGNHNTLGPALSHVPTNKLVVVSESSKTY